MPAGDQTLMAPSHRIEFSSPWKFRCTGGDADKFRGKVFLKLRDIWSSAAVPGMTADFVFGKVGAIEVNSGDAGRGAGTLFGSGTGVEHGHDLFEAAGCCGRENRRDPVSRMSGTDGPDSIDRPVHEVRTGTTMDVNVDESW